MIPNEYEIDREFWEWWVSFWKRQEGYSSILEKLDISLNSCYNNNRENEEEKNPEKENT